MRIERENLIMELAELKRNYEKIDKKLAELWRLL